MPQHAANPIDKRGHIRPFGGSKPARSGEGPIRPNNPATVDFSKLFAHQLAQYGIAPKTIVRTFASFERVPGGQGPARASLTGAALLKAIRLTGDPEFSLRLGQAVKVSQFGALGFALLSCETLRDVLALMVRYHPLLDISPQWLMSRDANHATLAMVAPGLPLDRLQALTEAIYSSLSAAGREVVGKPITDITVHVSYPAPQHARRYQKYFHAPTRFDQPRCEIILPNGLLDQSIRTANPAGHVVFRQQCEEMLRSLNDRENISAAVRRLVMTGGPASKDIQRVAGRLALSQRTLRRRLREEGTSFRTICDEVRNVLSRNYLSSTQLTVAEIADLLGYAETANFRRAFKRWNGVTPQTFRHQSSGETGEADT